MDLKQLVMLALQVSIICTVFGFGLRTEPAGLLYLARRPGLLFRSLLAVFVIMPAVAVVLVRLLDLRQGTEVSLVALAISPVPPLLPRREASAGGKQSYGLAIMATLALLAIGAVPLAVEVLQHVLGRPLAAAPSAVARVVLVAALLPLVAGMAFRAVLPAIADWIEKPVGLVAKILLPLAALLLLAGSLPALWAAVGDGTIVAIVIFVAAGLAAGHLLGGPDPEQSVVLALSSACRHPAIAFSLASSNFPEERVGGTILLYVLVSWVVCVPYIAWQRRHAPGAMTPA